MTAAWEQYADWWIDGFTEGADPEYAEQILPLAAGELVGCGRVLDVGCGEGQLARLAAALGADEVVGVEPSWRMLATATARAGGPCYVRAQATALPVADARFDAVVACLVLEHVVALDAALAEVARVLRPAGRLCLFLNHPLLQSPGSGWILDSAATPPVQYWGLRSYLDEHEGVEEVGDDVLVPFVHRPLGRYVNALVSNGLHVERMVEPPPPPGFVVRHPAFVAAPGIPRLLYLRAVKRAGG
jgi:SAM-dependent methyltransferase